VTEKKIVARQGKPENHGADLVLGKHDEKRDSNQGLSVTP